MNPEKAISSESAKEKIEQFERELTRIGGATTIHWMGVEFAWQPLPLCKGGKVKRGKAYGIITYTADGVPLLTLADVIAEITKPAGLKQALREALAVVECSLCGRTVNGHEALNAFEQYTTEYRKKPDGTIGIIHYLNRQWHRFTFTYKPFYEAQQLADEAKFIVDPVEQRRQQEEIHKLINTPLNYDADAMELTLCPHCLAAIYRGELRERRL